MIEFFFAISKLPIYPLLTERTRFLKEEIVYRVSLPYHPPRRLTNYYDPINRHTHP